jgi:4-alpha-glucanotransferase
MALGLMLDLAVGVRADGAETWGEPDNFARGVSVGAPPDGFNPKGQNWALAPLNPLAMRDGGLSAFAETLRASMRHAGALRVDHILGFRQNFWVAEETGEGAYIRFPQDAMFAVLAIEAERNRCLVASMAAGCCISSATQPESSPILPTMNLRPWHRLAATIWRRSTNGGPGPTWTKWRRSAS